MQNKRLTAISLSGILIAMNTFSRQITIITTTTLIGMVVAG